MMPPLEGRCELPRTLLLRLSEKSHLRSIGSDRTRPQPRKWHENLPSEVAYGAVPGHLRSFQTVSLGTWVNNGERKGRGTLPRPERHLLRVPLDRDASVHVPVKQLRARPDQGPPATRHLVALAAEGAIIAQTRVAHVADVATLAAPTPMLSLEL